MTITIGSKTYRSGKITAAMSRRAMELNLQALEAAAAAEKLKDAPEAAAAQKLTALLMDNLDQKARLICDVFANEFTAEDLLDAYGAKELNAILNKIASGE